MDDVIDDRSFLTSSIVIYSNNYTKYIVFIDKRVFVCDDFWRWLVMIFIEEIAKHLIQKINSIIVCNLTFNSWALHGMFMLIYRTDDANKMENKLLMT